MAGRFSWAVTDAEEQRGEQAGLDTLVVHAVSVGHWVWGPAVVSAPPANGTSAPPGEATAARLKAKD